MHDVALVRRIPDFIVTIESNGRVRARALLTAIARDPTLAEEHDE